MRSPEIPADFLCLPQTSDSSQLHSVCSRYLPAKNRNGLVLVHVKTGWKVQIESESHVSTPKLTPSSFSELRNYVSVLSSRYQFQKSIYSRIVVKFSVIVWGSGQCQNIDSCLHHTLGGERTIRGHGVGRASAMTIGHSLPDISIYRIQSVCIVTPFTHTNTHTHTRAHTHHLQPSCHWIEKLEEVTEEKMGRFCQA